MKNLIQPTIAAEDAAHNAIMLNAHINLSGCPCEECQPDHIVESVRAFRETDHFDAFESLEATTLESDEEIHFSRMMDRYCDEQ